MLPELVAALDHPGIAVLEAPPGTGKTTAVPPALLDQEWVRDGRILVLEPRRIAARAAAARMAEVHGEAVGERFGWSVRHERRVGPRTRVEVLTEGLLTRRLQNDPGLDGVAAVVLDEFHERSLDVDLALALLLDVRESLRSDLRLLVMSATLDSEGVAAVLGGSGPPAPVVRATAPLHQVATLYRPGSVHDPLHRRVAEAVREALRDHPGDVLVFLPGRGEIRRTRAELSRVPAGTEVVELHGSVPAAEQDAILAGSPPGVRRVVLATSIAETSVTVPGVRIVVDSGRRRSAVVDPRTGLPGLSTTAVSLAGADQRRGRAGRTAPGVCIRLWSANDEVHRIHHDPPEVVGADLSALVLQVLAWGAEPSELPFPTPLPPARVAAAKELLEVLGALDRRGRLNPDGRAMAELGAAPRLAAIALAGRSGGAELAADVVSVLDAGTGGGAGRVDLADAVDDLRSGRSTTEAERVRRQWWRRLHLGRPPRNPGTSPVDDRAVGRLAVAGFPDRVARRRDDGEHQLLGGQRVRVPASAPHLRAADWIVALDMDARHGETGSGTVHCGAVVDSDDALAFARLHAFQEHTVRWVPGEGPSARTRTRWGTLTLSEGPWATPDPQLVAAAVADGIASEGLGVLGRLPEADQLRSRVAFAAAHDVPCAGGWPDMSDDHLVATLTDWLSVQQVRSPRDLARLDVHGALLGVLGWDRRKILDETVPQHIVIPGGRRLTLKYGAVDGDPGSVLLSVRLQDLVGLDTHPHVGPGRVPVTVELLSPAGRPLQRTGDLPAFWRGSYGEVRKEMRGRYPKHDWPERPWEE